MELCILHFVKIGIKNKLYCYRQDCKLWKNYDLFGCISEWKAVSSVEVIVGLEYTNAR